MATVPVPDPAPKTAKDKEEINPFWGTHSDPNTTDAKAADTDE